MGKKEKTTPFDLLQTRDFSLFRKWMDQGGLSESGTHELTEIQRKMPAESFRTELKALNTKYNVMIWAITFAGLVISAAIMFRRYSDHRSTLGFALPRELWSSGGVRNLGGVKQPRRGSS